MSAAESKNVFLFTLKRIIAFMKIIFNVLRYFGLDWFIIALAAMITLAFFFPLVGAKDSAIPLTHIATYGVSLIFFFYGLGLNMQKLVKGLSNWKLHLFTQLSTFILFPIIVICAKIIAGGQGQEMLWLGIFFLACLPSTVSSAVVMVSIAKGNVTAAIFNASISTLIGVFLTPFFIGLYMSNATVDVDYRTILLKLTLQVVLPVILGMLLNRHFGKWAFKNRPKLRYFDQSVILLIIYTSFCESFSQKVFEGYSVLLILELMATVIFLFYVVYGITYLIARAFKFSYADTITHMFCSSTKSLVHASVISKILFASSPYIGIILLPIMMYHPLQLLFISIFARKEARKKKEKKV